MDIQIEDQTLWNFVRSQELYRKSGELGHYFLYNGVDCYGQEWRLPWYDELTIRPCYSANDIGMGAGESVIKRFKK